MIKPIKISPLNTSSDAEYKCAKCGTAGSIHFTNNIINTDNEEEIKEKLGNLECQKCGNMLWQNQ